MSSGLRLLRIGWEVGRLATVALRDLATGDRRPTKLPVALRQSLERLGPVFVKFGQGLSLRRDFLPDEYIAALHVLQDQVAPFPAKEAIREIEHALGMNIDELFREFDRTPIAAASIAQVHRAEMPDGRSVVVKVRRPKISRAVDRDMRALKGVVQFLLVVRPSLKQHQPLRIVDEIWNNLRKETDFRQEARNIKSLRRAFSDWTTVNVPDVIGNLYADGALVQEMSHGRGLDEVPPSEAQGLAQLIVDAYLHQFFTVGLFHADPHPGNLFVMRDGRLCFHDLGLLGYLDRPTRRNLALFLQAFISQDAGWVLDAATDLGLLGGEIERVKLVHGIGEILSDFSSRSLKEWSIAEIFVRVLRLAPQNFAIPYDLLVLMRAAFLVENALRTLDPDMNILETLIARGERILKATVAPELSQAAIARLKSEVAVTAQDIPNLIAVWLHQAVRGGAAAALPLRIEGLKTFEVESARRVNRLSLALVTVGLYIAASLLFQHSIGPTFLDDIPVLGFVLYVIALWLTFRLVGAISRSGRL